LTISDKAIRAGLANVRWPGRLEILNRDPLIVVDGAHNGDSARKLAAALRDVFGEQPWTIVLGISADKDIPAILDALVPLTAHVIVTRAHNVRAGSRSGPGTRHRVQRPRCDRTRAARSIRRHHHRIALHRCRRTRSLVRTIGAAAARKGRVTFHRLLTHLDIDSIHERIKLSDDGRRLDV
jgi:hypothetical protein